MATDIDFVSLERYGFPDGDEPRPVRCDSGYWTPWHVATEKIERLRSELLECQRRNVALMVQRLGEDSKCDALLADAERYRWLREMATPELGKIAHLHSRSIKTNFSTPMAVLEANVRGDVDAAIDAALAAKG